MRQENSQLKSEVGLLRYQLHSKSIALHDLSCSLDEEKYKNSLSTDKKSSGNTSFNATYDEEHSDEVFK